MGAALAAVLVHAAAGAVVSTPTTGALLVPPCCECRDRQIPSRTAALERALVKQGILLDAQAARLADLSRTIEELRGRLAVIEEEVLE